MVDLIALKQANLRRWAQAQLTRGPEFARPAQKAVANRSSYLDIEERTGVHWCFVAVTHYRESSQDFTKSLAQGDPWNRVSTHVPAGRGPFQSFEDAAVDALVDCAPHAARNKDWSIGGMLTLLEQYNGLGYASRGIPSPYIWSGTDQYRQGKYIEDGVFSATTVDKQLGCAGLILAIQKLDPTVRFDSAPLAPVLDGAWLQSSLNKAGATPPLVVDGIVGPASKIAVKHFQKGHPPRDGIAQ
jgi:lysozyme family protein